MPFSLRRSLAAVVITAPLFALAAEDGWVTVVRDNNRQVQIDRAGIVQSDAGTRVAWARMQLAPGEAEAAGYASVHALNRYDCLNRSFTTVRRRYLDARLAIVREEELSDQTPQPVVRGGVDERLWREVCQPPRKDELLDLGLEAERLARAVEAQSAARPAAVPEPPRPPSPARLVEPTRPPPAPAAASAKTARGARSAPAAEPYSPRHPLPQWDYEGITGPLMWGRLLPDWSACDAGRRQSPIELQSGLVVPLEPVVFDYRPTYFRVIDTGQLLRIHAGEGLWAKIRGVRYELIYIDVHRPGETRIDGRIFDLSVDLHHRAADGSLAVVSIQFEAGNVANPAIASWLASLPLERGGQYTPDYAMDLSPLLPASPAHFLYSGSLTTPPCTEGVTRIVMKQPLSLSWEQLGVIAQLHPPSARPLQDAFGRRVLESR